MIPLKKLSLQNYAALSSLTNGEQTGSYVRDYIEWPASHEAFTQFIGRLRDGGLISCRYQSNGHGKVALYTLTEEGKKAYADFKELVQTF